MRNTKYFQLSVDFYAIAVFPIAQATEPASEVTFLLRTDSPVGEVTRSATAAIAEINPGWGVQFTLLSEQ